MLDPHLFPTPLSAVSGALLVEGDCRDRLRWLPDGSVHCAVTSPPYWGLRDYGLPPSVWGSDPDCPHEWGSRERGRRADLRPLDQTSSQGRLGTDQRQGRAGLDGGRFCRRCGAWRGSLGLEPTVELYVEHLVGILRELRRVLRDDGTLWLNLGDCYASARPSSRRNIVGQGSLPNGKREARPPRLAGALKEKDLVGVPWRVALALQADGWYLRSDIVWNKPNALPESVRDRPTKSHEYLFLLAKSPRYYYDADAIREPHTLESWARSRRNWNGERQRAYPGAPQTFHMGAEQQVCHPRGRNKRTVWTIPTQPLREPHFAAFPEALVAPCIRAGTSQWGACRQCGTPWTRVVAREKLQTRSGPKAGGYGRRTTDGISGTMIAPAQSLTIGWQPTCSCGAEGETIPCVVLDPFGGSGTVAKVATELGRHSVLIELNPAYLDMAKKRTRQPPLPR
jgi:DNA modification methylase